MTYGSVRLLLGMCVLGITLTHVIYGADAVSSGRKGRIRLDFPYRPTEEHFGGYRKKHIPNQFYAQTDETSTRAFTELI